MRAIKVNEGLKPRSANFGGEIQTDTEDFVWNETILWIIEQMNATDLQFTYDRYDSGSIHFNSPGGIVLVCEKKTGSWASYSSWEVKVSINNDTIFKYKVNYGQFSDKRYFATARSNGDYAKYAISGAQIKGDWVKNGLKGFKDLATKRKCWDALIKDGIYLERDIPIQWYSTDTEQLSYAQTIALSQTIQKALKSNTAWKAFIKGVPLEKFKSKLANMSAKGGLTVANVVKFLEATPAKHITIKHDNSGPWATTGTSEGIDEFDIGKLQKMYPETNRFLMDNMPEIWAGLQKKKYSHPLGYYTFLDKGIRGDKLQIKRSCTTYYN